jgi:2'-5' RNA ligase
MPRMFVGLMLPEALEDELWPLQDGVPGARWMEPGQHHLTLVFLGDVPVNALDPLDARLRALSAPPMTLQLGGVGHFPPRGAPRTIWLGVEKNAALTALHRRIADIARALQLPADLRAYAPHVSVARLHQSPPHRVAEWEATWNRLRTAQWPVTTFELVRSLPGHSGSDYHVERSYELRGRVNRP